MKTATKPKPRSAKSSAKTRGSAPSLEANTVNLRFAKAHLSALVDRAEKGVEILLTRDGKPAARLVPVKSERKPFIVNWELLNSLPMTPDSTPLIREDRDGGVG